MIRVEEVKSVPRSKGSKRPRLWLQAAAKWAPMRASHPICPIFGIVHGRGPLKTRDPNGHFGKD